MKRADESYAAALAAWGAANPRILRLWIAHGPTWQSELEARTLVYERPL